MFLDFDCRQTSAISTDKTFAVYYILPIENQKDENTHLYDTWTVTKQRIVDMTVLHRRSSHM